MPSREKKGGGSKCDEELPNVIIAYSWVEFAAHQAYKWKRGETSDIIAN
jgi:hypothetical protein